MTPPAITPLAPRDRTNRETRSHAGSERVHANLRGRVPRPIHARTNATHQETKTNGDPTSPHDREKLPLFESAIVALSVHSNGTPLEVVTMSGGSMIETSIPTTAAKRTHNLRAASTFALAIAALAACAAPIEEEGRSQDALESTNPSSACFQRVDPRSPDREYRVAVCREKGAQTTECIRSVDRSKPDWLMKVKACEDGTAMLPIRRLTDPQIVTVLKEGGLTVDTLPPTLSEAVRDPARGRAIMKAFAIALGTTCDGCHVKGDFAKATKEKEGAERAYNRFVAGLRFGDGTPLFCDSCHQGKWSFLQRTDHDEVATWMKHNFVDKLVKKDGTAISCATCHQK